MPTLVHLSDIHFGPPELPLLVAAVERRMAERRWDVIAISGDLTQRNRHRQFAKARAFIARARASAPTAVIPGNHDVAWWWCVGGLGVESLMYRGYARAIDVELEPRLQVNGVALASINSSPGIQWRSLTTRLRDLSVVGHVTRAQWQRATRELSSAPAGDLRVLMLHHNVLRGTLSNRWGLTTRARGLDDVAATQCEVVLCGHDHESQVEQVERGGRRYVVSQVNTLSNRARGGRAPSFHEITWDDGHLTVTRQAWDTARADFVPEQTWDFVR